MNFNRARYYDPGAVRFLSEDPIGFDGGDENLYRYVRSKPIKYLDPFGKWPEWIDDGTCAILKKQNPNVVCGDFSQTLKDAFCKANPELCKEPESKPEPDPKACK